MRIAFRGLHGRALSTHRCLPIASLTGCQTRARYRDRNVGTVGNGLARRKPEAAAELPIAVWNADKSSLCRRNRTKSLKECAAQGAVWIIRATPRGRARRGGNGGGRRTAGGWQGPVVGRRRNVTHTRYEMTRCLRNDALSPNLSGSRPQQVQRPDAPRRPGTMHEVPRARPVEQLDALIARDQAPGVRHRDEQPPAPSNIGRQHASGALFGSARASRLARSTG